MNTSDLVRHRARLDRHKSFLMESISSFFQGLDEKHWTLIATTVVSTVSAIGFYVAKRRHDVKDKLFEKRHASYKAFIVKLYGAL